MLSATARITNQINPTDWAAGVERLCASSHFFAQWWQKKMQQLDDDLAQQENLYATFTNAFDLTRFSVLVDANAHDYWRQLRPEVLGHLMIRDLIFKCGLEEVVATMSAFADAAVTQLVDSHYQTLSTRYGTPIGEDSQKPQQLIVIAMGKLGGRELNVSSDIDLIFVYPEEGECTKGLSNHEFFTKVAQKVVHDLAEQTAFGFVFRTDTALRPNGLSGPLVCGFGMLQHYFYTQGREWERYAWLKSRAMTGNLPDIAELEKLVNAFVYRRYLDYNVIEHLRQMHAQIQAEGQRLRQQSQQYQDSVKVGVGGIRQIEFLAQMAQLLRGGREPRLQLRATRDALQMQAELDLISRTVCDQLMAAYEFLRRVEHGIQYLEDAQNHYLPTDTTTQIKLANLLGYSDYGTLLIELNSHRTFVATEFDRLFAKDTEDVPATLAEQEDHWQFLWQHSRISNARDEIQKKINHLTHAVEGILSSQPQWDAQKVRTEFADWLLRMMGRTVYLTLLLEYPHVLKRLLQLQQTSSWAAQYLIQHPILLDELISPQPLELNTLATQLPALLAQEDLEQTLITLRDKQKSQTFALLLRDLSGELTLEALSDELSHLADLMIDAVLQLAWMQISSANKTTPPIQAMPPIVVLAYGKLGSKELGYQSDLDLVFVYDDSDAPSDATIVTYHKLVQKFISFMTMPTVAGILYDIDLALRPHGASGAQICSYSAFLNYQQNSAWLWEHQALTRARACAGTASLRTRISADCQMILRLPREAAAVKTELNQMRIKMRTANPIAANQFDLKQSPGGMIDLEFIVQYWILARPHPRLLSNTGNIDLIQAAAELNYLSATQAQACIRAYRGLRRQHHALALQNKIGSLIDSQQVLPDCAQIVALWQDIFETPSNSISSTASVL